MASLADDRLAHALEVEGQQVTVTRRSVDGLQNCVVPAEAVDLGVEVSLGHDRARDGDLEAGIAGDGHGRAHLDDRIEGDGAGIFAGGDGHLAGGDGIELLLLDRHGVVMREGFAQGFLAGGAEVDMTLQQLARRLAWPEAGEAYLVGNAPES